MNYVELTFHLMRHWCHLLSQLWTLCEALLERLDLQPRVSLQYAKHFIVLICFNSLASRSCCNQYSIYTYIYVCMYIYICVGMLKYLYCHVIIRIQALIPVRVENRQKVGIDV